MIDFVDFIMIIFNMIILVNTTIKKFEFSIKNSLVNKYILMN